jgi:TolB-like protein/Flp pilus assembly protein TadD
MSTEVNKQIALEIAHVLFIDIVGYSKLSINEQRAAIDELNEVVRTSEQFQKAEASDLLIKIPTGDGMVLVFYTSPEAPVQCAVEISRALKEHPHLQLRMGVHSGPVSGVVDVTGRANLAGAGLNMANRVMSCGDAGHILVSKRIAEDLGEYEHWRPFLHDLGTCEVKHGVRIGIANLYDSEVGNPQLPRKLQAIKKHRTRVRWAEMAVTLLILAAITAAFVFLLRRPPHSGLAISEKSIAVLPFENLSADPENAFFTDGVQDQVLNNLAKIADLKVISRTSVMQYKTGGKRNLRQIANELGVAHVVEGSVQRAANRVRVSAQLIDARTDMHLWVESYDRPLDDVFAIQSEIAKAIATQLKAKLSPTEKAAIEQPPTTNLIAYDRYLRAEKLFLLTPNEVAFENVQQAIRLLDQAVAHDPSFLLAYCLLSRIHAYLYFTGFDHTAARVALAKEARDAALRLRPDRGEPHLTAAWVAYHCYLDYETALAEVDVARRRLPNDPAVFEITSLIARRQGDWEQCKRNLERAVELDPRSASLVQAAAGTYQELRRFSEAAAAWGRALAIAPGDVMSRVGRAQVDLESRADTQPMHAVIQSIITEDPGAADAIAERWLYLALCRRDAAEMASALASLPLEVLGWWNIAVPRSFFEGLVARASNDATAADKAFTAARGEMEKIVREQPDYPEALCALGMTDAALGRKEAALREGRRAVELLPITRDAWTGAGLLTNLAVIYACVGEKDLAIKQLEEVVRIPSPLSYGQLRLHPFWDPLRGDPRFEKLVEEAKKPVALK